MFYQRLFQWIFILSALLMAITYFYKDRLPDAGEYKPIKLDPPTQSPTDRSPFTIISNQEQYTVTPKFDYELTGVVVTYHDADDFTDIWHHKRWKDFLNVRDLCVIWNPNVSTGIYKTMRFSSDSWTCWVSWNDKNIGNIFQTTALSNNHILTNNNAIKAKLLNAEVGDVIKFKGVLAEYSNSKTGFSRGTSVSREDHGNGACETVFIEDFRLIKKANPFLRSIYTLSKWSAMLSLIGFLIMAGITPFRPRQ